MLLCIVSLIRLKELIQWKTVLQKQPYRGVLKKRRSDNLQQIYRRKPMPKWISVKMLWNFFEIPLQHGCFPVRLLHIFRTPFPKNTFEGLLLVLGRQIFVNADSCSNLTNRSGFRTAAAAKMKRFVIIVNGWKPFQNGALCDNS